MNKIKVRYNLGRGKNYMKWKIESKSGVEYHSPQDVQLIMHNCILKNNKKLAKRIYEGENKSVCSWIICESIQINYFQPLVNGFKNKVLISGLTNDTMAFEKEWIEKSPQLKYNPKVFPYWQVDIGGKMIEYSLDDISFQEITSIGKNLYYTTLNGVIYFGEQIRKHKINKF
jgi:hypothetical protein